MFKTEEVLLFFCCYRKLSGKSRLYQKEKKPNSGIYSLAMSSIQAVKCFSLIF